ncbi:ankyrin repeat-containing protein [Elysia marginata]|uniref:Ankyrin repeat-containing protein n=1 Tax=Elysia marginata TaxID=1093978 RepID=A0AAV4EUT0_9GAST|nr:ankyrin repeat-containing protein [Elysia marginata]
MSNKSKSLDSDSNPREKIMSATSPSDMAMETPPKTKKTRRARVLFAQLLESESPQKTEPDATLKSGFAPGANFTMKALGVLHEKEVKQMTERLTKSPEVVSLLAKSGADLNIDNANHQKPIHVAAELSSLEVVKALLDNGVDADSRGENGMTPMHYAAAKDNGDIMRFLVSWIVLTFLMVRMKAQVTSTLDTFFKVFLSSPKV